MLVTDSLDKEKNTTGKSSASGQGVEGAVTGEIDGETLLPWHSPHPPPSAAQEEVGSAVTGYQVFCPTVNRRGLCTVHFSSVVQSCLTLCDPMDYIAGQATLSITNTWSLFKLTSIQSVMPSNHLILCPLLLLLPSIFPKIRVFSNESVLRIRCRSTVASASASVLPMNIQD